MNDYEIEKCYKNSFGIDLKKYHKRICRIDDKQKGLIKSLNQSNRIIFEDSVSTHFKLELYNNLLYLMGDKTCYLCSHVIESVYGYDLNWVFCIAIPDKIKINGETDISKSSVIVSMFTDLITEIPKENHFYNFINQLEFSYSECTWFRRIFSMSLFVKLAKFWNYKQKIVQIFELGLLYPLELVIFTLYNNIGIKNEQILKYFVASLSESTNKIISFDEINKEFNSLSQSEIEDVLAINYVSENIHLEIMDDDYFADLLEIDSFIRYDSYDLNPMRERANSIFKISDFKNKYIKLLNKNFRALENKIRKNKGYDEVGSFIMEQLLFNKLNDSFPNLNLISQYSPYWLRPQRIDIFIEECNLAIEYHGAQHYLPIDFFGGKDSLKLRQELDRRKKDKCFENNVRYVEISYKEDFDFAFTELKLLIEDILQLERSGTV